MNKSILRQIIYIGLFSIPFIPFLVSGSLFFPFITTKAFAWRLIIEIIFSAWIILAFIAPEYRVKRSPILYALGAFLLVVGVADLFGIEPVKSFWSNFERMEGYITMLHLGAFFLVIGSVFKDKEWKWWWNTTLAASALMVFYCIFQLLGAAEIHQGGVRVDGTLGNAAYLALYLLIHIFVATLFLFKSKTSGMRWTYLALIAGQAMTLYFTATRGAILGLLGGLFVIALMNVANRQDARMRKWSRILLGVLLALIAGFFLIRDTSFVRESLVLNRFATLSFASWKTEGRAFIWPMAVEGIKERPLLGWGQENFNYVFAEHYKAEMFGLEPWFDRAHNIFLDWGISAGLLGLGAYLSLYATLLFAVWKAPALTYIERSIMTGLTAAYFFNNLFVFDNLISYILFFALLAYMHSRTVPVTASGSEENLRQAPILLAGVTVALAFVIYSVNLKPIVANANLVGALGAVQTSAQSKLLAMDRFEKAYRSSRLGRPEAVEWISSSATAVLSDESVAPEARNSYFDFAQNAVLGMTKELEGDPRYEMVAGNFLYATGYLDEALAHFEEARRLMPEKQALYFSIGQTQYSKKDYAAAFETFKYAYELAPENQQAKQIFDAAKQEFPQ